MGKAKDLAEAQRRALARLKELPALSEFYLAGGSAIAYHLSHRRSNDLDLFSSSHNVDLDRRRCEIEPEPWRTPPDARIACQALRGQIRTAAPRTTTRRAVSVQRV